MKKINFGDCEAKIKHIIELLAKNPSDWDDAQIVRDELAQDGPAGTFQQFDEGNAPPMMNFEVNNFCVALDKLETALNKKDRPRAEEHLATAQAALATLKRRSEARKHA
jgi:hypothetical protein